MDNERENGQFTSEEGNGGEPAAFNAQPSDKSNNESEQQVNNSQIEKEDIRQTTDTDQSMNYGANQAFDREENVSNTSSYGNYIPQEPVKVKKGKIGLIVGGVIGLLVILCVTLLLAFKMPLLKMMNPKAYLVEVFKNTSSTANSGDLKSSNFVMSMQLDEFKVMGTSYLKDYDRFGFELSQSSDTEQGVYYGSMDLQLGGADTLQLKYAMDNGTIYLELPQLYDSIISMAVSDINDYIEDALGSSEENLETESDSASITDEKKAAENFKKLIKNAEFEKADSSTLVTNSKKNAENIKVTIPAEDFSEYMQVFYEDMEYEITNDIVLLFGIVDNKIVRIEMEEFEISEIVIDNVVIESYGDSMYMLMTIADVSGVSMELELDGTMSNDGDAYIFTYDSVRVSSGSMFEMVFSAQIQMSSISEVTIDMNTEEAKDYEDIIENEIDQLVAQVIENLRNFDILPEDAMQSLESMFGFNVGLLGDTYDEDAFDFESDYSNKSLNDTRILEPSEQGVMSESVMTETGISYKVVPLESEMVFFFSNETEEVIGSATVEVTFYDESGNIVGTDYNYMMMLPTVGEYVVFVYTPTDRSYNPMPYAAYEVSITNDNYSADYFRDYMIDLSDQVEVTSNVSEGKVFIKFKNNSDMDIDSIDPIIVFYSGDKIVGVDYGYVYEIAAGRSATDEVYGPEDADYNPIAFDDYKIFLNYAYSYDY